MERHGGPTRVSTGTGGSGDPADRTGHSRMGIASVVIAVLATLAIVVLIVVAGLLTASAFQGVNPENVDPEQLQRDLQDSPAAVGLGLVGAGVLVSALLYLLGLALGVAGVVQRRRKRLFAVLGLVLNGLIVLALVALTVFGVAGVLLAAP